LLKTFYFLSINLFDLFFIYDIGKIWTQATGSADWTVRSEFSGVDFNGKMWIFGGIYSSTNKNDIWYSSEQVRTNVEKLIASAKKVSTKIVFVGHTAVDETKTNPLPWNADKSYKNEYIKQYDELIKSICQEQGLHFIDIMGSFMQPGYQNMLVDGLHPDSTGHEKIYEIVKDYLVKNQII